jgi:hypothetical protein
MFLIDGVIGIALYNYVYTAPSGPVGLCISGGENHIVYEACFTHHNGQGHEGGGCYGFDLIQGFGVA